MVFSLDAVARGESAARAPLIRNSVAATDTFVPPQNLEAEESVLGAMMLSPGAIGAVSEVLSASDFYRESHAKIYKAALQLYGRGDPVDARRPRRCPAILGGDPCGWCLRH